MPSNVYFGSARQARMEESESLVDKALAAFTAFLRRNRLKMTKERRMILEEMLSRDAHLEAEDLLLRLREKGKKVSRATIYRTFDLLLKAGLITKSDFGHSHAHYERSFGQRHHDHMICERSGRLIEFTSPELDDLLRRICEERDFRMKRRSLQIFGYCRDESEDDHASR